MNEPLRSPAIAAEGRLGILTREIRVHLLNCSSSGCLLEINAPVDVGTIGSLRLVVNGDEVVDDVQVVRCQPIEGAGSLHHVGARILWTRPPDARTLRHVLHTLTAAVCATPGLI